MDAMLTNACPSPAQDGPDPEGDLMAAVVARTSSPLWVIGQAGRVIMANPAAAAFLGYRDPLDIIGGPSHELLHSSRPDGSEYLPHDCRIVRSQAAGGTGFEWFLTRQGDLRRVSWSTAPLSTDGIALLSFTPAAPERRAPPTGAPVLRVGRPPSNTPSRDAVRERLYAVIHERLGDPHFSASVLAAGNHLSARSLQTLFQDIDRSPAAEIRRLRLERARTLLEDGHSVRAACHSSGYLDPDSFGRAFRRHFGYAPSRLLPERTSDRTPDPSP